MVYLKKKNLNATESHENAAVHTAILCLSFLFDLYEHLLSTLSQEEP